MAAGWPVAAAGTWKSVVDGDGMVGVQVFVVLRDIGRQYTALLNLPLEIHVYTYVSPYIISYISQESQDGVVFGPIQ